MADAPASRNNASASGDGAPAPREGPLHRAVGVLRLLATAGRRGMTLTDLARATGLPNGTLHRLLHQLMHERLAMRIEDSRHYAIGPLAYEVGLAAAQQFDLRGLLRPTLERLAQDAGANAYLVLRSGDEAVCIDVVEGPSPLRVVTLQPGSRRPLGLGAGGLAILAALPADEQSRILPVVAPQIEAQWGLAAAHLGPSLDEARHSGFAVIRNRINPGVTAVGAAFHDTLGQVMGAVSVAAASTRMDAARISLVQRMIRRSIAQWRDALGGRQWLRYID